MYVAVINMSRYYFVVIPSTILIVMVTAAFAWCEGSNGHGVAGCVLLQ